MHKFPDLALFTRIIGGVLVMSVALPLQFCRSRDTTLACLSTHDSLGGTSACVAPLVWLWHQHGLYATGDTWMLMEMYVTVDECYGEIVEALVIYMNRVGSNMKWTCPSWFAPCINIVAVCISAFEGMLGHARYSV